MLKEIEIGATEIMNLAKKDAPADLRQLSNSISKKQIPKGFEIVAQSIHAPYQEFGTKTKAQIPAGLEQVAAQFKGPSGSTGDPIKALEAWVKRKGTTGRYSTKTRRRLGSKTSKEKEDRQAAFLIWRKIKKYGIKPHPYFFKQVPKVEPKLVKRIADIIQQII
ncbi:hypothetical protein [Paraflavitalea pollutisoli]|uniref:hypothetical protein n=1 Tax=Paraflavitalea pollutisoli TaxID=3034143 RepID=UPI0023EC5E06|nr:hypothetical protein [Paraflavitalea sp. H1-2-19X]